MLLLHLKSMLRNKSNLIYIILIVITFIFLNIALVSSNLIDCYYENSLIELRGESILEDLKELYISNIITLSEEQQEQIKSIKYVEDIQPYIIELPNQTILTYHIFVDNWKHDTDIIKLFDNYGISVGLVHSDIEIENLLDSYDQVKSITQIIKYIVILIVALITLLVYNNILNNQKDNFHLLYILGYKLKKIRKIQFINLLTITIISCLLGIIFLTMLYITAKTILHSFQINLLEIIIVNILIYAIILTIVTITNKKILRHI